ncbi:unnamed protein product [Aphanomyces euteiches]|nr:hypothetical protein AeRB84_018772 [Aphanomyces euteiches]
MWDGLCRARKRVCHWAGQHQTLLVGTGVVVACGTGVYYMIRRVVNEAENVTKNMQRHIMEQQRLSVHLRRTEEECKAAFLRFLPSVKSRIYKQLDLEGIVESLKVLDKSEKETRDMLWDDAKLVGFTRLYVSLYAYCLLQLLVHCELLIMGRETFEKAKHKSEEANTDNQKETLIAQHHFLSSTMEYFFSTGLPSLIETTEQRISTHEGLKAWRVHEKRSVQHDEMNDMFDEILAATKLNPAEQWQRFLIFPEDTAVASKESASTTAMTTTWLNELRDILDSPFFHVALQDSIDALFDRTKTQLLSSLYNENLQPKASVLPLAKVIPQLKTEAAKYFSSKGASASDSTTYWDELAKLDSLQHLATSIFIQDASIATSYVEAAS